MDQEGITVWAARDALPSFFREGPSEKLLGDRGGEGKNIHASKN